MSVQLRKLSSFLKRGLPAVSPPPGGDPYDTRVVAEQRHFSEDRPADRLPEIYQYWSNTFLRPRLQRSGIDGPLNLFELQLAQAYELSPFDLRHFLSIGSGDCQTEIALAECLVGKGKSHFLFECFELNPELVARGTALARQRGVSQHIDIRQVDANSWTPSHEYDGILANSSLHHIQNLECVFDGIARSLLPTGTFLTSDTIGRNGHMRWPEALEIVEEYWQQLPEKYRFNCQLQRQEHEFINWDCSSEGFEGIRAQDILPLLIERFDFDFFAGFANVVDPFIDRTFGHNFDPSVAWDRDFVDRLEVRDRVEIERGHIKPTHIVSAMCVNRPGRNIAMDGLTPRFCVRDPLRTPRSHRSVEAALEAASADMQRSDAEHPKPEGNDALPPSEEDTLQLDLMPADAQCGDYLIARILQAEVPTAQNSKAAKDSLELEITTRGALSVPAIGNQLDIGLGSYAAGEVHISARVGSRTVTKTIDIAPPRATFGGRSAPVANYSDLWWNPSEPGWGVGIHQHPSGKLVAFWLGYDALGAPTWLSLHPGEWTSGTTFEGPVYEHRGPDSLKSYVPGSLVASVAGTGSLSFQTWNTCRLTWQVGQERIVKDVERMAF